MIPDLDILSRQWARLGILFGARPAEQTPDLEKLLVATAVAAPLSARLFMMSVNWLRQHGEAVSADLLHQATKELLPRQGQPALGLMLESAGLTGDGFRPLLAALRPAESPGPLFDVERKNPALTERAHRRASPESVRWGVWCEPVETKLDAIRPWAWISTMNPALVPQRGAA